MTQHDLPPPDLVEHTVTSEAVFDGRLLHVRRDTVRLPNGQTALREYVVHPGAVAIIPLLADGQVVLERQFRYPLRREFIEFPAGKLEAGEDPLICGKRELAEETGYVADRWHHVTTLHPVIGYSDERIEIYLAEGLTRSVAKLDDEEFLEVMSVPVSTALQWLAEGQITDAKTVIGLFWLERILAARVAVDEGAGPTQR